MPLQPGDELGPYEITALIGKGGMGEAYKVHAAPPAGIPDDATLSIGGWL